MDDRSFEVRTDLAVEAKDMYVEQETNTEQEPKGVHVRETSDGEVKVTYVEVDEVGAETIGKKPGTYINIESQGIRSHDSVLQHQMAKVLANEFQQLLEKHGIANDAKALIVGLGNGEVTPDSLGPRVVQKAIVTEHLFRLQPEHVSEGFRPVMALTPGVMGVTGIETSDIIFGVINKVQPDFVIAIDALASRSVERVNATIQIADTGIHPGSGIGNKRKELSKETLNIPVFSVGVPTVVDAVTITSDTIDYLFKHLGREIEEKDQPSKSLTPAGMNFGKKREFTEEDLPSEERRKSLFGLVGGLGEQEKKQLIKEVLSPLGHNLMVTPKEVDGFMKDIAHVVSSGLNAALHEAVDTNTNDSYTK
ncbi:germination protein [Pontibacillus halophilus JSM 076056 = DSM 19796]|uniref:Germination protease n=1 Tax=Pontibacillus halophilus JSM 076056 = DSM 19796 TaxID=1385510 RepID=A0A0A5GQZ5_9BACI|nr:GPR endopeptidase [Pontibacillus halophilus]KGX93565.1 germination protein [Pontibacillus halophilus JSM 076056 = DSM 19796]